MRIFFKIFGDLSLCSGFLDEFREIQLNLCQNKGFRKESV